MTLRLSLPLLLALPAVAGEESVLEALQREAKPADVRRCEERVALVLKEHAETYKDWMRRAPPPPPDLRPLKLPLSYLAHGLFGERPWIHADAVAASEDPRRIDLLWEVWRKRGRFQEQLVRATDPARAGEIVLAEIERTPRLTANHVAVRLMQRHLDALPHAALERGLRWLREGLSGPPDGSAESKLWTLRLRLGDRSDRDLLAPALLDEKTRHHAIVALRETPGPSKAIARAAAEALKSDLGRWHFLRTRLWMVRMEADEAEGLAEFLKHFADVHRKAKAGDDESRRAQVYLVHTLVKLRSPAAVAEMRSLVAPGELRPGLQQFPLVELARRNDPEFERLWEAWAASVPERMRRYVEKQLPK